MSVALLPLPIRQPQFRVLPDAHSNIDEAFHWTQPLAQSAYNMDGFCKCPDKYTSEFMHGKCTIYFGACPHRHGMNILGRINEVEVDKPRLEAMLKMANFGLQVARAVKELD